MARFSSSAYAEAALLADNPVIAQADGHGGIDQSQRDFDLEAVNVVGIPRSPLGWASRSVGASNFAPCPIRPDRGTSASGRTTRICDGQSFGASQRRKFVQVGVVFHALRQNVERQFRVLVDQLLESLPQKILVQLPTHLFRRAAERHHQTAAVRQSLALRLPRLHQTAHLNSSLFTR
jgi:hypothetical protein